MMTDVVHDSTDPYQMWLEAERHADRIAARPGRAKLLEDEDDVYHVVMFDDIKQFLFPIRSPEVRLHLVYAYLTFQGLPFSPPEVSTASPGANDPHLRFQLAYNSAARAAFWPPKADTKRLPWQSISGELMEPEHRPALSHPFGCPIKSWASERQMLFAQTSKWFREMEISDLTHVDVDMVRASFDLLRPLIPDPGFTLAYFAFEAAFSPDSAVTAAKAILAEDRDNLVLWDGYARLERQRGKVTASRTVYATALQAALASSAPRIQEDRREAWASWAEMEFEHDPTRCLDVLLMAVGLEQQKLSTIAKSKHATSPPSPLTMLKARQVSGQLRRLSALIG
jgi:hypothetical protein